MRGLTACSTHEAERQRFWDSYAAITPKIDAAIHPSVELLAGRRCGQRGGIQVLEARIGLLDEHEFLVPWSGAGLGMAGGGVLDDRVTSVVNADADDLLRVVAAAGPDGHGGESQEARDDGRDAERHVEVSPVGSIAGHADGADHFIPDRRIAIHPIPRVADDDLAVGHVGRDGDRDRRFRQRRIGRRPNRAVQVAAIDGDEEVAVDVTPDLGQAHGRAFGVGVADQRQAGEQEGADQKKPFHGGCPFFNVIARRRFRSW